MRHMEAYRQARGLDEALTTAIRGLHIAGIRADTLQLGNLGSQLQEKANYIGQVQKTLSQMIARELQAHATSGKPWNPDPIAATMLDISPFSTAPK